MAEQKGNELVATTGGGDSGPEDIFSKLGPLLDMASEVRMNYKKGAASSFFDVTIRDLDIQIHDFDVKIHEFD